MFRRKHKDEHATDEPTPEGVTDPMGTDAEYDDPGLLGSFSDPGTAAPPAWDAPDHVPTAAEVAQARKAEKQRARQEKARKRKAPKMPCPSCGKPNPIASQQGIRCILCKGLMPVVSPPPDQRRGADRADDHAPDPGPAVHVEPSSDPPVDPWAGTHLAGGVQPDTGGDDAGSPPEFQDATDAGSDAPEHGPDAFGPPTPDGEPDIGIDIPVMPPSAQPPPIPPPPVVPDAEHFDPNALIIDEPSLPRPTSND